VINSAPVLQYFDSAKSVIIHVDASDNGLGGTRIQGNRPVAYTSSTMTKSQMDKYVQIERVPSYCECYVPLGSVVIWPPPHYNRNIP